MLRIGRSIREQDDQARALAFQERCSGRTTATLAVTAPDQDWEAAPSIVESIELPVASHLFAEPAGGPPAAQTPWVIAAIDGHGPSATRSAAPTAVALEIARAAAKQGFPVRIAIVVDQDGAAGSNVVRIVRETSPNAPVLILGPLGGPVATALGSTAIPSDLDDSTLLATLYASTEVDGVTLGWRDLADQEGLQATSRGWIGLLATQTGLSPSSVTGMNAFALRAGLDAAFLGEDPLPLGDIVSIAGTPVDTVDQVDVPGIAVLAESIAAALAEVRP